MRHSLAAFFLTAVFGLAGCGPPHVAYHSTADVPYYTESTSTQMQLVGQSDEEASEREYVAFVARDDGKRSYLLLAPKDTRTAGYSFDAAIIGRAVPLKKKQGQALIDGLAQTLELWDQGGADGSGRFYEFMHAPEQEVDRVSENVVEWHPALKFTASHIPNGASARLLLGDSPNERLQYVVELNEREDVVDFRQVLQTAQKQTGSLEAR